MTGVQRHSPETSKWRTRVGIARLASRLSKFAVAGHPSDGAMTKISDFALEGHVSLIIQEVRGWQPTLGTLAHLVFLFSLPIFPRISIGLA
jgi:hypothetical protein